VASGLAPAPEPVGGCAPVVPVASVECEDSYPGGAHTVSTDEGQAVPDPSPTPPPWLHRAVRSSVWTLIGAILIVLALLWFARQAQNLLRMLVLAQLFAFAVEPGVMWFHEKRGWRRGSATALILFGSMALFVVLGVMMVPVLVNGFNGIVRSVPHWIDQLNAFTRDHFHTEVVSSSSQAGSSNAAKQVGAYLKEHTGDLVGAAGGAIGAVFNVFTIALFTFYLAADGPKVRRALLSRMPKERQERVLWAINEAVRKTGGYLYSRGLLAAINGSLLFVTLLIVGCPYPLPISLFAGIVAEFIPIVGTYIAGTVPVIVTLSGVGVGPALIVVAEILVYQSVENYFLSPRLSQKTMELNAGIAFGAAMAGGAIGGFIGAFFALPVAAVIQSYLSTYPKHYEVMESDLTKLQEPKPPKEHTERRFLRRGHGSEPDGSDAPGASDPVQTDTTSS
jgi:predicted PurR-regulated permease PerM